MITALLLFPLGTGLLSFIIRSDRIRRGLLVITGTVNFILVILSWYGFNSGAEGQSAGSGWIGLDAPGLLFLFITSLLFLASSVSAVSYISSHKGDESSGTFLSREAVFTACLILFLDMMTLAVVSRHISLFWVAVEATTLTSAPLICFRRSDRSLEATWKYLLICSVGIAVALIGTIALTVAKSFDPALANMPMTFSDLAVHATLLNRDWLKIAFTFVLVGYGTKMGLAPLHTWLPDAHSESPSPVSALLSGALLNCAFLGLLRMLGILRAAGLGAYGGGLLCFFGAFSLMLAAWFIVRQKDYKRLLAYSSIEHMGILALAAGAGPIVLTGGLLHAVNHSLTKGTLFLAAGNILDRFGTKSIRRVRGVLHCEPLTAVLWIAGFLSICGIPPFGTFVSEISILSALGKQGEWLLIIWMLAALGVVFVGMSKTVTSMAFGSASEEDQPEVRKISLWKNLPPLLLILCVLVLGLWVPDVLKNLIDQASRTLGGFS